MFRKQYHVSYRWTWPDTRDTAWGDFFFNAPSGYLATEEGQAEVRQIALDNVNKESPRAADSVILISVTRL